jgi:hypothetical protein
VAVALTANKSPTFNVTETLSFYPTSAITARRSECSYASGGSGPSRQKPG